MIKIRGRFSTGVEVLLWVESRRSRGRIRDSGFRGLLRSHKQPFEQGSYRDLDMPGVKFRRQELKDLGRTVSSSTMLGDAQKSAASQISHV